MTGRHWIGLALVMLAAAGTLVVPGLQEDTGPPGRPTGPTHGCDDARGAPSERPTLCLLNAERRRNGREALRRNPALDRAARAHAEDMAARDYFAHEAPDGTGPHRRILRAGYRDPRLTGENLAFGEREAGAPSAIVDGWMHSPGHRRNILRPGFAEIGIAVVEDGDRAIYVTTFGRR
ncbi:MAG TPA: CAP domain-containing protein [Solirubrobacteraceae bacterium]|nr:CAP domain-containing protein [Solirubrobacteraceae bacterium]